MRKNNIRIALERFIERIASGGGSERETDVLPALLSIYFKQYGDSNSNSESSDTEDRKDAVTSIVQIDVTFPSDDTFVTVEQIARFLGLKPGTIWKHVRDGVFPRPEVQRKNYTRWKASDIRKYREEAQGAA